MSDDAAEYVRRTTAGAEYVTHITQTEADQRARRAFQDLALRIAPPAGTLFDFGAGPGIDARYFAERGLKVEAYDVDPRMREYFRAHCRDLIEAGSVTLDCSDYADFLRRPDTVSGRRVDLVVANFAPLNLVADLPALFARFHAITAANGKVLASVLNPFFLRDVRLRWWRHSLPELLRTGYYFMPGPQAPHFRRRLANFAALSPPCFELVRVYRGLPAADGGPPGGFGARSGRSLVWLRMLRSRYMFLLFERLPDSDAHEPPEHL